MGSQTATGSERLRAYWMPTMERYFIDLMLDQMHRGNRVGHTFTKQAWADMLVLFSAKFGSPHDKDLLKNRYSTLWKQYNDVKNLLEQSGFSWNDSQQVIVADDYVWDTYIKAHLDAQHYRNKPLMNFNDLCLIFAYTTADGRYSRSSHDIDFDDEMQGIYTGEGKEAQTPTFGNCTRTYWTLPMDQYLIDLLLDQVLRGNKIGRAFITQAWNEMVKSFNSKFGSHYDKEVLKNRYKHLRQQYSDVKILLDQSGFSWDENQEMVTAEEYVWDSFTKAYPDAQSYKFRTVPSYQKLCVIYGEEGPNGRPSCTAHSQDLKSKDPDSDYSKTDWTPPMDRYLIDLLLNQVRIGHKVNHIFSKEAWIDILASFNDRFESHHDKNVLNNQYIRLKKLYNDIKHLLKVGEFYWDESRQMVMGPDDVWDAYIKEHPDGTLFRTKAKPNFNDLCLVYGKFSSAGRWNESDRYVGFNIDGRVFQASRNRNCLRSGWTPPMDRYFIDLMLEQIRRGNMVDQNFNEQAWSDMVVKFVVEFGSQHDKDGLKSRFEDMRNLFLDMRTLTDQNGFAWDEMQQMITASGDIWDDYIKDKPRAQSYRSRTLPNYNDLFLIYGNTSINGRRDFASCCTDLDDDFARENIRQEDDQSSSGSDTLSIAWTKPMDRYFIDLMLGQVLDGNKVDDSFSKQAWSCMMASLNEKFGLQFDKWVLENRYLSLMDQYDNVNTFFYQNGFAWNEIQQKLTADNLVWEAYIEEHPDAKVYKDIILENYSDLSVIFGDESHDDKSSYVSPEMGFDYNALEMGMDGVFGALQSLARDIEVSNVRKRPRSTITTHGRKLQKTSDKLQEAGRSNTAEKLYLNRENCRCTSGCTRHGR
ncbi:uncharacterized protein LOC130783958 isoform X2 [Actinidia eriantha]|uniref:uncharacterized protein LOC130783958 isoform X2 n=1 Tax=Actinidia eriantha TaxID=165200 RepID=UPI00258B8307|nr:uncharacterized protein LOC130783958 isoform X2 [Actinidia eriantha]